jgi:hypothetical protein
VPCGVSPWFQCSCPALLVGLSGGLAGGMARRPDRDGKVEALSASRTLNAHAAQVSDPAFAAGGLFDARDLVQVKYEMVRRVEAEEMTVAAAAAAFGFSRQSVYTAQKVPAHLQQDSAAASRPTSPARSHVG